MLQDLKDFMAKVQEDETLQARMGEIVKNSHEDLFNQCSEVAAELGYTITREDMQTYADEYQDDLGEDDLNGVAGGVNPIVFQTTGNNSASANTTIYLVQSLTLNSLTPLIALARAQ